MKLDNGMWMGWGGNGVAVGTVGRLRGTKGVVKVVVTSIDDRGSASVTVANASPKSGWDAGNRTTIGVWFIEPAK